VVTKELNMGETASDRGATPSPTSAVDGQGSKAETLPSGPQGEVRATPPDNSAPDSTPNPRGRTNKQAHIPEWVELQGTELRRPEGDHGQSGGGAAHPRGKGRNSPSPK
jgi:hypothetical protein